MLDHPAVSQNPRTTKGRLMARKTICICDRCLTECIGLSMVDTGNDYAIERGTDGLKQRVTAELCTTCLLALREWMKPKEGVTSSGSSNS